MMRVVHDETRPYGRITVQFGLSGLREEVQASYSKFMFLPDTLRIEYRMSRLGEWLEDDWTLNGPRILQDGSLSKKIRLKKSDQFGRRGDTPAWITEIAEKYQPTKTLITGDDTTLITYPEDAILISYPDA